MHYPIFLELDGHQAVVIGGGTVATRKVRTLLEAKAAVTVISPQVSQTIRRLSRSRRLRWLRRRYRAGDLRGARLVVAATNDEAANRRICTSAKRARLLVNCVKPPEAGNFIVPALTRWGELTIAISTGGASPALAKHVRQTLEQFFHDGYADLTRNMRNLRKQVARGEPAGKKRAALYRQTIRRWMNEHL